ncbi:hypothetical protein MMC10_010744 [Thelotrema lepadinum]|nr:hypothetical protein [Thelotrema lepadinum]
MTTGRPASKDEKTDSFSKVFRVQGIPLSCKREDVRQLVAQLLDIGTDVTIIQIRSLAVCINQKTKTATIGFRDTPQCLISGKSEWTFTIPSSWGEVENDIEDDDDFIPRVPQITIDTHFEGFTVLRSPKEHDHETEYGPRSMHLWLLTMISCIAITGLGGHAFGSFKQRGGPHMWLCDSLPHDLPGARIMLWGYDSKTLGSRSFQDLEALGSNLRLALQVLDRTNRSTCGNNSEAKPFTFVAHSLGGLVFKEAIIQMKQDRKHHGLLNSIHGALFFGVPSQGMDITTLIPMVRGQPNEALVHSLGKESQLLRNQRRNFPLAFDNPDSEIVYFYETVMSPTAVQVGFKYAAFLCVTLTGLSVVVNGRWPAI